MLNLMRGKIFEFFKGIYNFIKINYIKALRELGKLVGIFILNILIAAIFSLIFEGLQGIIMKFFSLIFTSYFLVKIVSFLAWLNDNKEIKTLKRMLSITTTNKMSLYSWTGKGSVDYYFFYDILKEDSKEDTLENLLLLKEKIQIKVGEKKSDYFLLKNYLEAKDRTSISEKFNTWFVGIVVGLVTAGLSKFMTSGRMTSFLNGVFLNNKELKTIDNISIVLDILNIAIFIIAMSIYIINEIYREKRKVELIKGIVDSIIYEKENEPSSSTSHLEDTE